jgi:hypothetical protein
MFIGINDTIFRIGATSMRRFLLSLTFISFSAWSQPGQPQAQPPIVVQVQMPPSNPWVHLVELVLPGIIGAVLALFGVWLTNRNNAANNADNRQHELKKMNREHSFVLKRDVLMRITQSLVQTLATLKDWHDSREFLEYVQAHHETDNQIQEAEGNISKAWADYSSRRIELEQATASARLAVSNDLWKSAQVVEEAIAEACRQLATRRSSPTSTIEQVEKQITNFIQDAGNELGVVRIDS